MLCFQIANMQQLSRRLFHTVRAVFKPRNLPLSTKEDTSRIQLQIIHCDIDIVTLSPYIYVGLIFFFLHGYVGLINGG